MLKTAGLILGLLCLVQGQGLNDFRRRLIRCPTDPILQALENFFDKRTYIKNQVACITNQGLTKCGPDQFCDSCCCDDVGLRLRVLAPDVIQDPNEFNCVDADCICRKREGRRVLNRLKNGRSSDGQKYKQFYDQIVQFYTQNPQ